MKSITRVYVDPPPAKKQRFLEANTKEGTSCTGDRIHKWRSRNYSFVFVLASLCSKISVECFFVLTRLVRIISIKTKE